jgi:hypothetical protein
MDWKPSNRRHFHLWIPLFALAQKSEGMSDLRMHPHCSNKIGIFAGFYTFPQFSHRGEITLKHREMNASHFEQNIGSSLNLGWILDQQHSISSAILLIPNHEHLACMAWRLKIAI